MASNSFGGSNMGSQIGTNTGPINNTHFYMQPEPSEPRPEPLSTVPFLHDPDFVSRDTLFAQIQEKSSAPGSRVVLVGLGGVGKTRLAIEYCYRVRQQFRNTWIFWVHASSAARCEKSLRDLADRVKIPGRKERDVNIFQLVKNWLQDEQIGEWILVLDNVDDDELLRPPSTSTGDIAQPPLRYLLEITTGFVLVTSRNRAVSLSITGNERGLIDVQPMNTDEALTLLQHKLNLHTNADEAGLVELAKELEFMPLAIIQAASYIIHHSPRCSVLQYLKRLQKSDRHAVNLLKRETHLLRDWEAKDSIILTWQISFDYVRNIRPSAANMLSLMSFFDRQGIPEFLLRCRDDESDNYSDCSEEFTDSSFEKDIGPSFESNFDNEIESDPDNESDDDYESDPGNESVPDDMSDLDDDSDLDDEFEEDIATLKNYSFISTGADSTTFTMHRLVQLTVHAWLENERKLEPCKENFIKNLCHHFPDLEYKHWGTCERILPHVKLAASQPPKSQSSQRVWAMLLFMAARYAGDAGYSTDAVELASKSRSAIMAVSHAGDKYLHYSMGTLVIAYMDWGWWDEAEKLQLEVMAEIESMSSDNVYDTKAECEGRCRESPLWETREGSRLLEKSRLATIYSNQGRLGEAEKLCEENIEMGEAKFGNDNPLILMVKIHLAEIYWKKGQEEDSEKALTQISEIYEREDRAFLASQDKYALHVILYCMHRLASTYASQERWDKAEKLQLDVFEASKIEFGHDDPRTLLFMKDLAMIYGQQGRLEDAERLLAQVFDSSKKKLGEDHPLTLATMTDLALFWRDLGRNEDAIDLLRKAIQRQRQILGPVHRDTVRSSEILIEWESNT